MNDITGTTIRNTVNDIPIVTQAFGTFRAITNAPGRKTNRTQKRIYKCNHV